MPREGISEKTSIDAGVVASGKRYWRHSVLGMFLSGSLLAHSGLACAADVIGDPATFELRYEDTLLDVARQFDVGYIEMRQANPGIDPWLPGEGRRITIPSQHVLPDAPRRGIVINLPELRLYYFGRNGSILTVPLGIGREGKETPTGQTRIVAKRKNPAWYPTESERAENPDLPNMVPPGPDNPMGDYALYLGWKGYAIHATNRPYSIGRRDSNGCIRMYPEDAELLYREIPIGTPVLIVDQPAKAGWRDDRLYLEVHGEQDDAESLETTGQPREFEPYDADLLAIDSAGDEAPLLDWRAIRTAEFERSGLPVVILDRNH